MSNLRKMGTCSQVKVWFSPGYIVTVNKVITMKKQQLPKGLNKVKGLIQSYGTIQTNSDGTASHTLFICLFEDLYNLIFDKSVVKWDVVYNTEMLYHF